MIYFDISYQGCCYHNFVAAGDHVTLFDDGCQKSTLWMTSSYDNLCLQCQTPSICILCRYRKDCNLFGKLSHDNLTKMMSETHLHGVCTYPLQQEIL